MPKTRRLRTALSAADYRTVRHRLNHHTNAEIAERYGVTSVTVRSQLHSALEVMRQRSNVPLHGVSDLLLLAERTGVRPLPLPAWPTNVAQGDAPAVEPEPAGVG